MKLVHLSQGSREWKRWRRDGLGGSDVANLLGLSPFEDATPEFLLEEKVHGIERESSYAMRRGTLLEPTVRQLVSDRLPGSYFAPVCVEHDDEPWMRCSLDGLSADGYEILEIKCPNWQTHDQWLSGLIPQYYVVQIQWQLLITGLERCWAVSFNSGQRFKQEHHLAPILCYPDPELQAEIHSAGDAFWRRVVEAREWSEGVRNGIEAGYPG